MDLHQRLRIEREHHDKVYERRPPKETFIADRFYMTRPYGMKQLLDKVGPVAGLTVLDVGCGLGLFSLYFASRDANVYAIDISSVALHSFDPPMNVVRLLAPGEFLPLQDNSVDVVWGAAILHHLDLSLAVPEFHRVLKPGGRCFFYEPLGHNPVYNLWRRMTPHLRTPTERPLLLSDLKPLLEVFGRTVEVHFYHLIASLPQAFAKGLALLRLPGKPVYRRIQQLEPILARGDNILFRVWTVLQRYSQASGIICTKL